MGKLTRFGVSLDEELLEPFDDLCRRKGYGNRSEAIRDLIRKALESEGGSLSEELLWRNDEWGFKFDANLMLTEVKVLDWISVEDIGGI